MRALDSLLLVLTAAALGFALGCMDWGPVTWCWVGQ